MAAGKKQCFLRFLYWNESSPPSFKVRGLQMTTNFVFSGVSWGVHSVRLHPGGGSKRGAKKEGRKKKEGKERERKKGKKRGAKEGEKGRERKYAKEKEKREEIKRK